MKSKKAEKRRHASDSTRSSQKPEGRSEDRLRRTHRHTRSVTRHSAHLPRYQTNISSHPQHTTNFWQERRHQPPGKSKCNQRPKERTTPTTPIQHDHIPTNTQIIKIHVTETEKKPIGSANHRKEGRRMMKSLAAMREVDQTRHRSEIRPSN